MSAPIGPGEPPKYVSFETLVRGVMAQERESRSSVKIGSTAKGAAQPEVKCYEDVTAEEMQRLLDLAIATFEAAQRRLNLAGNISQ